MSITRRVRVYLLGLLTLLALGALAPDAEAQRGGGKYALEYEGAMTGGVTGIRASYATGPSGLVIDLPAVTASYPTVRLVRRAGAPARPAQIPVGSGAEAFTIEFSHPDLAVAYAAQRGSVRVTEIVDGHMVGEFTVVAAPVGNAGGETLTIRGRFDAGPR